jgi:hypothetical protein
MVWPEIEAKIQELYQLLDKCARLQVQYPQQRLVPVLVCRRAHYTTFVMAKNLGFAVLPMMAQPILPPSSRAQRSPLKRSKRFAMNLAMT